MEKSIIRVIENALNHVDIRLMNHGRRVSYLTYRLMRRLGEDDPEKLKQAALIGLLHDIGAYKTEEINDMVRFESNHAWDHAIYSYLFFKYFSPVAKSAPAILFHHANCNEISYLDPPLRRLAQCLCVADRADILSLTGHVSGKVFSQHFHTRRGTMFDAAVLDAFFRDGWEELLEGGAGDETFLRLLYGGWDDNAIINAFCRMIVFAIDFRSPQTVAHTVASTCVSEYLGTCVDLDAEEKKHLRLSAMLHDVGKIGMPPAILEKPHKLTGDEMAIMKQHVTLTRTILDGFFDECALRLATRHHERLDGSGYPHGMTADELTTGQRLVAVADIFSALTSMRSYKDAFPQEKVVAILREMAGAGLIDTTITEVAVREYDVIMAAVTAASVPILESFWALYAEYRVLRGRVAGFADGRGKGEIAA